MLINGCWHGILNWNKYRLGPGNSIPYVMFIFRLCTLADAYSHFHSSPSKVFFLLWYGLHSVGSPSALNQLSEMHTSAEVKWFAAKLLLWLSVYLIRWPSLLEREMHSLISRTALSLWPAVTNHGLDMWQKILLWCLCYAAPLARSASLFLSVWLVLFLFPFNLSSLNASCAEPTEA